MSSMFRTPRSRWPATDKAEGCPAPDRPGRRGHSPRTTHSLSVAWAQKRCQPLCTSQRCQSSVCPTSQFMVILCQAPGDARCLGGRMVADAIEFTRKNAAFVRFVDHEMKREEIESPVNFRQHLCKNAPGDRHESTDTFGAQKAHSLQMTMSKPPNVRRILTWTRLGVL